MFTVIYHALLIGASLLVPVPFLDEKLASFIWKHMVSELAKNRGQSLTNDQILALSYQSRFGLSEGCLFVVRRIFRELLQEILFFLEWRKAINLATDAYYSGYLLNELFAYDRFDPSQAGNYAIALQKAKQGINTKLVKDVFRANFRSSKGVLTSVAKWLSSITVGYVKGAWRRRKNRKNAGNLSEAQMETFFEMHRSRFQELLKDLIASLQAGIGTVPREHFDELRRRLFDEIRLLEGT
jgi:hypothetical protein